MILKKLYIKNFGNLSEYEMDLVSGINSVCEQNGYGKSTITAFLKAMFYGLAPYKSNTKDFLDRMHYYPFSASGFGGYVVFEMQGREYRIERTFAPKSDTEDTMTVYCDATPTDELGKVPGVKIFGINKDSFENLLCVDSFNVRVCANDDINKKLNNYVDNVSEDFDITKVAKRLTDASKSAAKDIKELKGTIKETETAIANLKNDQHILLIKNSQLIEAEKERDQALETFKIANEQMTLLEKWNTSDYLEKQCLSLENAQKELMQRYPKSLPTMRDVVAVAEAQKSIQSAMASLETAGALSQEQDEYSALRQRYENGVPSQQELELAYKKISMLDSIQLQLCDPSLTQTSERFSQLNKHFHGESVSDDVVRSLESDVSKLNALRSELIELAPEAAAEQNEQSPKQRVKKAPFVALLIAALLLVAIGVFAMSSVLILGVILVVVGGMLIFADMFAYLSKSLGSVSSQDQTGSKPSGEMYLTKKTEHDSIGNKILMTLANYRYNGDDPAGVYYEFSKDVQEYSDLLELSRENKQTCESLSSERAKIQNELDEFFAKYHIQAQDNAKALDNVKSDIAELALLEKNIAARKEQTVRLNESIAAAQRIVSNFRIKFALPDDFTVDRIKLDIHENENLVKQITEAATKAKNYKIENGLEQRPEIAQNDMQQLKNELDEKTVRFSLVRNQVRELEIRVEELDSMELSLAQQKEQLDSLLQKRQLYDNLKAEIQKADQTLKDKYVKPIRDRFCEYTQLIEHTVGEKVVMDKDYKISFDIQGKLRRYEHLSSGNLAVCALCFRLALLDNMFKDEMPFIILDDPFVMLDKSHFDKVKQLIEKLSENKQIIYFCCHPSRQL